MLIVLTIWDIFVIYINCRYVKRYRQHQEGGELGVGSLSKLSFPIC